MDKATKQANKEQHDLARSKRTEARALLAARLQAIAEKAAEESEALEAAHAAATLAEEDDDGDNSSATNSATKMVGASTVQTTSTSSDTDVSTSGKPTPTPQRGQSPKVVAESANRRLVIGCAARAR